MTEIQIHGASPYRAASRRHFARASSTELPFMIIKRSKNNGTGTLLDREPFTEHRNALRTTKMTFERGRRRREGASSRKNLARTLFLSLQKTGTLAQTCFLSLKSPRARKGPVTAPSRTRIQHHPIPHKSLPRQHLHARVSPRPFQERYHIGRASSIRCVLAHYIPERPESCSRWNFRA